MKKDGDQAQGRAAIGPASKTIDRAGELRAALERGAYDGIHGIPRGLSAQSARTYREAREGLFFESVAGGATQRRYRDKPITINVALSWLEAHRAGQFDHVPDAVREQVALLASFQKRHERGAPAGSPKTEAPRPAIRNPAAEKSGAGKLPPKTRK